MKQFRTIDTQPAICKDPIITREMIFAAFTPLVVAVLALLMGAMLFVYFTPNASHPADLQTGFSGYGWTGPNYALATATAFVRYTKQPYTALGYALWVSCVQYHSQLACNQLTAMQRGEEMERR